MGHKGFSLVEMFIVIAVVIIFTMVVLTASTGMGSATIRRHAMEQAREYVGTMHPTWTAPRFSCQAQDTDGNGYVRCTVVATVPSQDGIQPSREVTDDIECSSYWWFSWNRGCQTPRWVGPSRQVD